MLIVYCMKLKLKTYEDFNSNKEMLDFRNYSSKSKYYDNSNKLMKDKTRGVAIKESV